MWAEWQLEFIHRDGLIVRLHPLMHGILEQIRLHRIYNWLMKDFVYE